MNDPTSTASAPLDADPTVLPAVRGLPLRLLRSEGAVLLAASVAAYVTTLDQPLWLLAVLLFLPDLFMVGYARSNELGALLYNLSHSYPAPAVLGALALAGQEQAWVGVALVWFAHIGLDRALGYGLKYETGFCDTHLGRIGR